MDFVRHQLGFSKTENRFPAKGTCISIYSRTVNAEAPLHDVLRASHPWAAGWEGSFESCSQAMSMPRKTSER
jgi:DNA helicase-2/ATP-dependent DNA helicase PcrA